MASLPPSPADTLRRVTRIARVNGWSVCAVAGLGLLLALLMGDAVGAGVALCALGSGAMELHGRRRLLQKEETGATWLVRSQLYLLGVVLTYAVGRLLSFDAEVALASLTPEMEAILKENGLSRADLVPLLQLMFRALYGSVIAVTLLYQGGMAFYYRRKGRIAIQAWTAGGTPPGA